MKKDNTKEIKNEKERLKNKKLNKTQLELLDLLYTFRFGTADLLAKALDKSDGRFVYTRLDTLVRQGYVGRNYNKAYKLRGQPASYYVLPGGIRALRKQRNAQSEPSYNPNILKNMYRDATASDAFISHSLAIFNLYLKLQSQYGTAIKLFTKSHLASEDYDYFPKPLPDLFMSLKTQEGTKRSFIEILNESDPYFVVTKLIRKYTDYDEEGDWDQTGTPLPEVLFVCCSEKMERRVAHQLKNFEDADTLFAMIII